MLLFVKIGTNSTITIIFAEINAVDTASGEVLFVCFCCNNGKK